MWTYQHSNFLVHQITALRDNYIYIIQARKSDAVLVIDPADADVVQQACAAMGLTPTHILNTHHHQDHTDGNQALIAHYQCAVIAHAADMHRIPGVTQPVAANTTFEIGGLTIQCLDATGHTLGHVVYGIDDALFCGDTIFGAGCGRLFEGSFAQMWHTLSALAALDASTKIYCAHEYTIDNLRFAASVDSHNPDLPTRIIHDTQCRKRGQPTIPSTIANELATNPMLRALDAQFCATYAPHLTPLEIFTDIRTQRNAW